jgi:hypothetical protein
LAQTAAADHSASRHSARAVAASAFRDFATKCHDKGRAPCPGVGHPVEEVATQHSGGAPGETRLERVGAQLAQNFSGRNESCDSRSSIHISTCLQHSFAHEEQIEALQWAHPATAARPHRLSVFPEPYSIVQKDVISNWIPVFGTSLPCARCCRKIESKVHRSLWRRFSYFFAESSVAMPTRRRKLQRIKRWHVRCSWRELTSDKELVFRRRIQVQKTKCWAKKTMFRGSNNEHRNTLSSTEVRRHASQ